MLSDRYYLAEIQEGTKSGRFYFHAYTAEGLARPEHGGTANNSWVDQAYESAVHEAPLSLQPWRPPLRSGAIVIASAPQGISPDELVKLDPCVNVHVANAIKLAKQEIDDALHQVRVTWHWQTSEEEKREAAVYLRLQDDTGSFREGFSLQQLSDESLTKSLIRRLYRDLLGHRSRTLLMDLLRGSVGVGKD